LKIVRVPSSLRGPAAWRVAAWNFGANAKPMFATSMHRVICAGSASIATPSRSSTSAEPQRDDSARLPCFATTPPHAAIKIAASVDTLIVPAPSPPVPQVSIECSSRGQVSGTARLRIAEAAPTSSSTLSPFALSAIRKPPICAGVASPSKIWPITSATSARDSELPRAA
jgi:hypothetical protein